MKVESRGALFREGLSEEVVGVWGGDDGESEWSVQTPNLWVGDWNPGLWSGVRVE